MSSVLYFAYGSNLDVEQMLERCPSSRALMRACLREHRLEFTHLSRRWGGGAADILPQAGTDVWGGLYQLERPELERLDGFEGGYERLEIRVDGNGSSPLRAISYTARKKGTFPPTEEYLAKMLHWGEHWRLPQDYLDSLRTLHRG
jgi:hypothetical protein